MTSEAAQTGITFYLPVIGEALGYSPVWEEWKGDFARAREQAEFAVGAAGQRGDKRALADAVLARSLVHILQGEVHAARKLLAANEACLSSDAKTALLAFAFGHLATLHHYRLSPGGGLLSMELEQRWNAVEFTGKQEQRWARLAAPALRR